jgi:LPS O-antigen subunit length determinant protein (WzzB/FepE family)
MMKKNNSQKSTEMSEKDNTEEKRTNTDEIDLIELALKIWAERKLILKTVAVFLVLGIIIAFGSKKEYKAECTFILDDNQGGSYVNPLIA